MTKVLDNTMVAIILQYLSVLNQHVVQLKLTQSYMSVISQKKKKKIQKKKDKKRKTQKTQI